MPLQINERGGEFMTKMFYESHSDFPRVGVHRIFLGRTLWVKHLLASVTQVEASKSWSAAWPIQVDSGRLINGMFSERSRGRSALVFTCSRLLFCLPLVSWQCQQRRCTLLLLHLFWVDGKADLQRFQIWPCDKSPADAGPQSMWDKYLLNYFLHFWMVNIPDILLMFCVYLSLWLHWSVLCDFVVSSTDKDKIRQLEH